MDVERFRISRPLASNAPQFRRVLISWYRQHGRDLPWRRTRDPYAILLSEIMLQQTQVATVLPYYRAWLDRFPDFHSLAMASRSDVLHAWQGLGYYSRARNLHATAQAVVAHEGQFPASVDRMRELPGVGRYTANAVATFAFDQSVPVVEANIARLLARLLNLQLPIDSAAGNAAVWSQAASLVPARGAGDFNSALMDLGALVCVPRRPKCNVCPVRAFCRAIDPASLPRKRTRTPTKRLTEYHGLTLRRGRVLLEQSQDRWCGMWILPRLSDVSPGAVPIYRAEFPFTHHRITLSVHRTPRPSDSGTSLQRWFPLDSLDSIPLPSPHRRAVSCLLRGEPQKLGSTLDAT